MGRQQDNNSADQWCWVKHSQIALINPKKPDLDDDEIVSFVPMASVPEETGSARLEEERVFSAVKKGYTSFQDGDILFAKITPCMENGKVALVDGLRNGFGFGSTEFHVSRLHPELNGEFYLRFLMSHKFRAEAQRNMSGSAGQLRVPKQYFSDVELPLPPLNEQRRIVAKIEELFSELDQGVESLKTARAQLKTYRQSLLETAVDGAKGGDAWETSLGDLIGQINQGWSPKCELNRMPLAHEWAVIKTTAVQPMKYVSEEAKPLPSGLEPRPAIEVQEGDLLMTRKGPRSRTGVTCLVRSTRVKSMLCDTVYRFRCDEDKVDPEYLEIALNAPRTLDFIDTQKSGISDSGISLNQKKVKGIPIFIPGGLEKQRHIVKEVQVRVSEMHQLEIELDRSLKRIDMLRQSILKRAFEGKLVRQDPNDEPASTLLERIRREQADAPKPKRHKRKTGATA